MATNFGSARPIDLLEMPNNAQSFSQMMNAYNRMSRLLMQQNRPVGGGGGGGSRTSTSGYWVADPTSPEGRRWISTAGSTDKARIGAETTGLQTLASDILRNDASIQEKLGKLNSLDVNSQEKLLEDIRQNDLPRLSQSTNVPIGELLTAALKPYTTAVAERAKAVEDDGIGNILWEAAKAGTKTMWDSLSSVFTEEDAAAKLQRGQDAANYWKQARENSAYLKDQYLRESAGEGFLDRADSLSDFITNVGVAAAENLGTMGATMGAAAAGAKTGAAVGSLIPGIGTVGGALVGAALGGAAANAPTVTGEFYQRLAEDPNLTEAQKLQAIEEYGTTVGALGATTGGLAGPLGMGVTSAAGKILGPRLASRVANQAVKRELAKGATQEAAEQAGKKAVEAYNARLTRGGIRNFVTRDLPNEFVPNAIEGLSELVTQNAVYNQATGQSMPVTSGLSEVLGAALGFGVPGAARRNWTRSRWYDTGTNGQQSGQAEDVAGSAKRANRAFSEAESARNDLSDVFTSMNRGPASAAQSYYNSINFADRYANYSPPPPDFNAAYSRYYNSVGGPIPQPAATVRPVLSPKYEGPIPQPAAAPSAPPPKTVKQLQKLVATKNFKRDLTKWQKDTPDDSAQLANLVSGYINTVRSKGYSDEVISDTLSRMAKSLNVGAALDGNAKREGTGGESSTTPTVGRVGQGGADELASADITVNSRVEADPRSDVATAPDGAAPQVAGDNRTAQSGGVSGAGVQSQRANETAQGNGQQVGAGPSGTPDNRPDSRQPAPRTAEPDQSAGSNVDQGVRAASPAGDAATVGTSQKPSGPVARRRIKVTGNIAKDIEQDNAARGGQISKKTKEVLEAASKPKKPSTSKPKGKKQAVKPAMSNIMSDLDDLKAAFSATVDESADVLAQIETSKTRRAEATLYPRDIPLAEEIDGLSDTTSYGPNNERGYKTAEENPENFPKSNNCLF